MPADRQERAAATSSAPPTEAGSQSGRKGASRCNVGSEVAGRNPDRSGTRQARKGDARSRGLSAGVAA